MKTIYEWRYHGYLKGYGHVSDRIGYSVCKKDYPSWSSIPKDVIVQKVTYSPCSATYQQYKFIRKLGPIYTTQHISDYIKQAQKEKKERERQQRQWMAERQAKQSTANGQPDVRYVKGNNGNTIKYETVCIILSLAYFAVAVIVFICYALEEFGWLIGALYSFFWIYSLPIDYFFT